MKSPCCENIHLKLTDYKVIDKRSLLFIFSFYSHYRKMKTLFFLFFLKTKNDLV